MIATCLVARSGDKISFPNFKLLFWQRDKQIEKLAKDSKVEVAITFGHTLYDLDILLKKNNGKAPMTYNGTLQNV